MYNAMEDAQRLRMARLSIDELMGKMSDDRLFFLVIHLISPDYAVPILKGLRKALKNKTDNDLERLISDMTH